MIEHGTESRITCETCGQLAFRRTVPVRQANSWRVVSYDTHQLDTLTDDHTAAERRLDEFYAQVDQLETELKATISVGAIAGFDLGAICPSACEPRTLIVPLVTVRAFAGSEELKLAPRAIAGQTAETLLVDAQEPVAACLVRLRARFEGQNE